MFNRLTASLLASTMLAGTAWAETTITAVMHSGLRVLDPIITTAHISRNHAYMIYDVLVAQDREFPAAAADGRLDRVGRWADLYLHPARRA